MTDFRWAATEAEPARDAGVHGGIAAELTALGFAGAVEVGRGGFGTVYRCVQAALDRVVAVKVVTAEGTEDRARFLREQHAMATLTAHPNIVAVLQVGETSGGHPFLVMPFCSLGSWQERLASVGILSIEEVLRVGVKIAGALVCAHQAGIVHRDVKPGNILSTDYGEPALSDFGIARTVGGFVTAPGVFHGSPAFSAPELLDGAPPTASSDVYGLGASLFTGLTGRAPFERRRGEDLLAQFVRITTSSLPRLSEYGIPTELATLVELAMARVPAQRPSALEFGRRLQEIQVRLGLAVDEMVVHAGATIRSEHRSTEHSAAERRGLIGRNAELDRLRELLQHSRLVTITGTGGVGKTALAFEAARLRSADYPDGVWLVELGDLRDGSRVAELVGLAMGLGNRTARPPAASLVELIGQQRALLVLDNCAQVIDAVAELIETVLPRCALLHIVATSREVLAVGGESVLALSPLPTPTADDEVEAGELAGYDAVALFVESARAAAAEFELTEHNAAAVARICARLDGLPLALEHAAALLTTMSVEQLGDALCDSYELLNSGNATTRQQSLSSCIEMSFGLCTQSEQQLWARLSAFAGNFDFAAAHYVSGEQLSGGEFLDVLSALVEKSILIRTEQHGMVHFRLLEILRDYGRSRCTATERMHLSHRHADWYHQRLAEADANPPGAQRDQATERLSGELRNLREAVEFELANRPARAAETGVLMRRLGLGSVRESANRAGEPP